MSKNPLSKITPSATKNPFCKRGSWTSLKFFIRGFYYPYQKFLGVSGPFFKKVLTRRRQLLILLTWFSIGLSGMEYRITGAVDGEERQEIEALLNEAEEEFLPRFELEGNDRLDIYVCKDLQEFLRHTGVSWWNGGHFVRGTIYLQRLAVLRERGILRQTVTHEFLHYCIWRKAGDNCPVWLNEGLVLNLTGEAQSMDCFNKPIPGQISTLDLDKFLRGKDRDKAKEAYCQAAVLVRNLLKKDGFKKICKLLTIAKAGYRSLLDRQL